RSAWCTSAARSRGSGCGRRCRTRGPRGGADMYPAPFEYHRAATAHEAVALLGRYGSEAKLLAGGHSLLPLLKLRFAEPKHLIDVRRVPGLSGVREEGGMLVICAATTQAVLDTSP